MFTGNTRFRNFLLLVVVLVGGAVLGAPTQASAAFRVTINATGAGSPEYFYATSSNSATFNNITIGNFTATINTDSSNFPGSPAIGSLSQTLTIGSTTGGNIDVLLEVIATVAGLVDGQITNAGQIASLNAAALSTFTAPTGNPLNATADVSAATNTTVTAGTATNMTTVNGTSFNSLTTNLNPAQAERIQGIQFNGTGGYTLSNHLIVNGINSGAEGTALTAVSGVNAVPAPAGLVLLLSAAPALALGWWRRRKAQPANA